MAPSLLPVLRSRLQGELLALMLGVPEREWTISDLAGAAGQPYASVATELRRLAAAGVIATRTIGRSRLVRANADSPYFEPLARLMLLSFGVPRVVAEEFGGLAAVEEVLIFGSWAARYEGETGPQPHDVDVLVIGGPDRDEVYEAARRAEDRVGREVNPTVRSAEDWARSEDGFLRTVRSSPVLQVWSKARAGES